MVMLGAGICVPILAILNAGLGKELGSPVGACMILSIVAFLTSGILLALTGPGVILKTFDCSKHLFLAGILFSVYILSISIIAPRFGLGNAIFFILLGQIASASIIDHFGLFGAIQYSISPKRFAGICIMIFGVWLTQNTNS